MPIWRCCKKSDANRVGSSMKHPAKQWVDYHHWANQRIIHRLKELPEQAYHQKMQSVFPSISEVMVHLYVTDDLWLDVMSGRDREESIARATRTSEETKGTGLGELEKLFADEIPGFSRQPGGSRSADDSRTSTSRTVGTPSLPSGVARG